MFPMLYIHVPNKYHVTLSLFATGKNESIICITYGLLYSLFMNADIKIIKYFRRLLCKQGRSNKKKTRKQYYYIVREHALSIHCLILPHTTFGVIGHTMAASFFFCDGSFASKRKLPTRKLAIYFNLAVGQTHLPWPGFEVTTSVWTRCR